MNKEPDKHGAAAGEDYNFLTGSPRELFRSVARYAMAAPQSELARYTTPWALQEKYSFEARDVLKAIAGIEGPQTRIALRNPAYVLTAGATGGFNLLLRHLMITFNRYNNFSSIFRRPTLLTTSPTYGAFVDLAVHQGFDVETITIVDDDLKVTLTPELLERRLDALHQDDNIHLLAFIDTSPHNPTGRVRSRQQTEELACVLANYEERRSRQFAGSLQEMDRHFDRAHNLVRAQIPLTIIDDLAYFGLEYRGTETHSFITIPGIAQNTHVLLSASKLGLPALRTGMILTRKEMADRLSVLSYRSYDAPTIPVARAAQAVWSMQEPFLTQRHKHLTRQRLNYRRNAQLVECLINGAAQTMIEADDRAWIKKHLKTFFAKANPEIRDALMSEGIPGLTVMTKNQKAGFFHLLAFEQAIWEPIVDKLAPQTTYSFEPEESRMNRLLREWKITLLPPSWMLVNNANSVYRMSFARSPEDIVAFAVQLSTMTKDCIEKEKITPKKKWQLPEGISLKDIENLLAYVSEDEPGDYRKTNTVTSEPKGLLALAPRLERR